MQYSCIILVYFFKFKLYANIFNLNLWSINTILLSNTLKKSDTLGALSSLLCMLHCIATPFLFLATTCGAACCAASPSWWQWLDYIFLIISCIAIINSTKNSNSKFIKYSLWTSWSGLLLFIINLKFNLFYVSEHIKFIPAFSLIALHIYNLKYCQCKEDDCCY